MNQRLDLNGIPVHVGCTSMYWGVRSLGYLCRGRLIVHVPDKAVVSTPYYSAP